MGWAPDLLVAEAISEDPEAEMLDTALETALGPNDAAEEVTLWRALETLELIELTTEDTELAIDAEADREDASEDWEAEAPDWTELAEAAALESTMIGKRSDEMKNYLERLRLRWMQEERREICIACWTKFD